MTLPAHQITPLDAYLVLVARAPFRRSQLRTRTQKILFRAEYDAQREAARPDQPIFPLFQFVRYDHGPYSKSVSQAEQTLSRLGLIERDDGPISARARRILETLAPEVDSYDELRCTRLRVERCAQNYERMTLGEIIDEIYALRVPSPFGDLVTVEQVPSDSVLVDPHERVFDLKGYQELFDLIWWKLTATDEELCATERVHSEEESLRFFEHEADVLASMQA